MLKLEALSKKYEERPLLENLNLNFEKGGVYAIIGASGSGKTTLLNILAKLEDYQEGRVSYEGQDLQAISDHRYYRDYLGYLFQNFGLLESQTIGENLDLGLVGKKLRKEDKLALKKAALSQVNLTYLDLNQKIYALSGGEAQRVALAKLILKEPPLILADEPTAALDTQNAEDVMDLLLSLRSDRRIIIIATHNPAVWQRADCIIDMADLKAGKSRDEVGKTRKSGV